MKQSVGSDKKDHIVKKNAFQYLAFIGAVDKRNTPANIILLFRSIVVEVAAFLSYMKYQANILKITLI